MRFEILERLKDENFYWNIGFYALALAGATHFLFLLVFLYLDVPFLVLLNVVSIGVYLYCIFGLGIKALDEKDESLIGWLAYFEILVHGVIATLFLGLESGFQYYIYTLVLIPFFVSTYSVKVRVFRIVTAIVVIVLLDVWGHRHAPLVVLEGDYIEFLHYMNLTLVLIIVAVISYFYTTNENIYRDTLLEQSHTDHLTDLYNRHYVSEFFKNGWHHRRHKSQKFALLLMDVDHFKRINDGYGHRGGDAVLVKLATLLKESVKRSSIISRWGGEEFLIVLEDGDLDALKEVAEHLREQVASTPMMEKEALFITMTFGGAVSGENESFEEVFERADKALYQGKNSGRNKVVIR